MTQRAAMKKLQRAYSSAVGELLKQAYQDGRQAGLAVDRAERPMIHHHGGRFKRAAPALLEKGVE